MNTMNDENNEEKMSPILVIGADLFLAALFYAHARSLLTLRRPCSSTDPQLPSCPFPRLSPPQRASFFFFNDTATTEIYTLSLHDALPIYNKTIDLIQMFREPHLLCWRANAP